MKRSAIVVLAAVLCIGLASVLSARVGNTPGRRVTLQLRKQTPQNDNWEKAIVYFGPDETYDANVGLKNNWDLLYGGLNYNGDRDWLKVNSDRNSWSRIRDLGELDWSDDIKVPVLPILPCRIDEPCGRIHIPPPQSGKTITDEELNPHIAKPIVGHMYVVHRLREKREHDRTRLESQFDYYALVRVEELKPNESCTITWKRISPPKD
jgi:hypothetical protein